MSLSPWHGCSSLQSSLWDAPSGLWLDLWCASPQQNVGGSNAPCGMGNTRPPGALLGGGVYLLSLRNFGRMLPAVNAQEAMLRVWEGGGGEWLTELTKGYPQPRHQRPASLDYTWLAGSPGCSTDSSEPQMDFLMGLSTKRHPGAEISS